MADLAAPSRDFWLPNRMSGTGRFGILWVTLWAVFLVEPLSAAWDRRATAQGLAGIAVTVVFAVWYVGFFVVVRRRRMENGWLPERPVAAAVGVSVALLLAVADSVLLGQIGDTTAVYVSVMVVMTTRGRRSLVLGSLHAGLWYLTGFLVPGWHPDYGLLLGMLAAMLAVLGFQQTMIGNVRLREAQQENQRLAVSEERNRFARDLHDILGHSLTVITVKAELAARLIDVDPERAKAEVLDLEWLSRDALADVRRAVAGYRELTLPGELSHARTALAAAEIAADLPNSTDAVEGDLRELFAWTVREGVTNVVRHSGASNCTVRLTATSAEVRDDGRGPGTMHGEPGHGLLGLRERAAAFGANVTTSAVEPHGFSLTVAVPAEPAERTGEAQR
ncbi:sensor histidine kinase [Demequina lutea]|uniref:Two-component system sensor histidine kinase DesK n=1 Tax=Demequina lutea TaxID=431489 RepID=A0A7Y9ZBU2_9MICO|nr:sensor histidine kinase [Demequina lutea]NYI41718.1 two-component system sensor histidine kinase DesK [Demequina lutea]